MVSITPDVEFHIRSNTQWPKLPPSVKAVSHGLYNFCSKFNSVPQINHVIPSFSLLVMHLGSMRKLLWTIVSRINYDGETILVCKLICLWLYKLCNCGSSSLVINTVLNSFRCLLVRFVKKDERKYYESLLQYSREHLMVSSSLTMLISFLKSLTYTLSYMTQHSFIHTTFKTC